MGSWQDRASKMVCLAGYLVRPGFSDVQCLASRLEAFSKYLETVWFWAAWLDASSRKVVLMWYCLLSGEGCSCIMLAEVEAYSRGPQKAAPYAALKGISSAVLAAALQSPGCSSLCFWSVWPCLA